MNTTTTAKIKLTRVLPGWYSFNDYRLGISLTVIEEAGIWTVQDEAGEAWIVESLKAARSFIAAKVEAA